MTQKEDTNRLDNSLAINRWRLVLGSMSDQSLSFSGSEREVRTFEEMEQLLDYLYNHAQGGDVREDGTSERCG